MKSSRTRYTKRLAGRSPTKQRGVVLFIALIVLVALGLAGVGLMRSVTSGVLVAGNLALKQGTTAAADIGAATVQAWLPTQSLKVLENNGAAGSGYFASWSNGFNAHEQDDAWWAANGRPVTVTGTPFEGWDVRYVLHRMCSTTGEVEKADCVQLGQLQQGWGYKCFDPDAPCAEPKNPLFRVTTRVVGPKSTISYVQSFVY